MIRIEVIHEARVRLIRYGWSWRKFWFDKAETFAVTASTRANHISMFWEYEDGERCDFDLGIRIRWAVEGWRRAIERQSSKERKASKIANRWRPLTR